MTDTSELKLLLESVREGRLSIDGALAQWPGLDQSPSFAVLDHTRAQRTGMPEVIFCQGKTTEQVVAIVGRMLEREGRVLATRASSETAAAVMQAYPTAQWHAAARIIAVGDGPAEARTDAPYVAVVTAGTSDIPVAEEAAVTLEFLGHAVRRVFDVGVAGIHRLLGRLDVLRGASVVIAVAGMEGALPSVLGGLVRVSAWWRCPPASATAPASAGWPRCWPCSTRCAPGVAVVNIDNGFGAAVHAHQIMNLMEPER